MSNNDKHSIIKQFSKFFITGVLNTLVDLIILNILIFATGRGTHGGLDFSIFKTISFTTALVNSYFLNKIWVFKDQKATGSGVKQFSTFVIISVIAGLINVSVSTLVVTHIPPFIVGRQTWPSVGALCGTAVAFTWNFLGYKYFVFKKKK